ncbi:MAG: diguanylate cyclase [Ruminococcus sp.]|nr:diguanylate cyclase [Ruminococcus sp.]
MDVANNTLLLNGIIDKITDGVYCVDTERRIMYWNKAAEMITGYTKEEMIGRSCFDSQLDHIDKKGRPLCNLLCPLVGTIFDGQERHEQVLLKNKNGHRIPVIVNTYPLELGGKTIGAIEIFQDCIAPTYDDKIIDELTEAAMHDELTGMPNRTYLNNFLIYKLKESRRFIRPFVLLFADIDNFRDFNNRYGHIEGDRILQSIARKLRTRARKDDLIGRWGGEEIIGIFSGAEDIDEKIIGDKFKSWIDEVEELYKGEKLHVTVSVGVTAVRREDTLETLIGRADKLMYISKKTGKNKVTTDEYLTDFTE